MAARRNGKTAVISRAEAGIGRAIAERCPTEGANIAVVDLADPMPTKAVIATRGGTALSLKTDVSQPADVSPFAAAKFGRADILISGAGIDPLKTFNDISFGDGKRIFSINVDSQFVIAKALVVGMKSAGWGAASFTDFGGRRAEHSQLRPVRVHQGRQSRFYPRPGV